MAEYISREEVMQKFLKRGDGYINMMTMRDMINEVPAADVQPVKYGHWIKERIDDDKSLLCGAIKNIKCSVCNKGGLRTSYFCPNCGTDMRGDINDKA